PTAYQSRGEVMGFRRSACAGFMSLIGVAALSCSGETSEDTEWAATDEANAELASADAELLPLDLASRTSPSGIVRCATRDLTETRAAEVERELAAARSTQALPLPQTIDVY